MITKITDQVSIGDSNDARHANNREFDAVLNVAIDLDIADNFKYRHKVGLFDGPGNHPATFFAAVVLLESLVKSGKRVLVHCQAGLSRSVMVVSAWLTIQDPSSILDAHLNNVMVARKVTAYRQELYALAEHTILVWKRIH